MPNGILNIGLNEAENLTLGGGYVVEGLAGTSSDEVIKAFGTGTASGTFIGTSGTYTLTTVYANENDGVAQWQLRINGTVVDSWSGVGGDNTFVARNVTLALTSNDVIEIRGTQNNGEFARVDSLTLTADGGPPPPPPPPPTGPTIALGTTEAESLTLGGGYQVEAFGPASAGAWIRGTNYSGAGTATGTFDGAAGAYNLSVRYVNENDGVAQWQLLVNGSVVDSWAGNGGNNDIVARGIALNLNDGDTIQVRGAINAGEFARVDSLILSELGGPPPPPPPPPPSGPTIALGTTEAETLSLSGGYQVESYAPASGGAIIRGTNFSNAGTATGTFDGAAGSYDLTVRYFNETDGVSQWQLVVNGSVADSWNGSGGSNDFVDRTVQLNLNDGDTIQVRGTINAGEFARVDSLILSEAGGPPPPPPPPPSGPTIAVGITQAEALTLSGAYTIEPVGSASGGALVRANGPGNGEGTISGNFQGTAGLYELKVTYLDESDGNSPFAINLNGVQQTTWTAQYGTDIYATHNVFLDLNPGDVISIEGARNVSEFARLDFVELQAAQFNPIAHQLNSDEFDVFVMAGQSNGERFFHRVQGDNSPGDLGNEVFENALADALGGPVELIDAATGGSASNDSLANFKFWWNLTTDQPGPVMQSAIASIQAGLANGKDVDGIIWAQGEADAAAIADNFSNAQQVVDEMKAATTAVFQHFRAVFGEDIPIFIQELGDFPEGPGTALGGPAGAMDLIRDAQADLVATLDNVYFGASTQSVQQFDQLHFTNAGYGEIAEDLAASVVNVLISGDQIIA